MKPLALVAATALLAPAAVAHADRREASVHVHAVGGPLSMEDDASTAGAGTGALAGLAVRASYATRNAWQYDTQLTLGYGAASFDQGTFALQGGAPVMAPYTLASQLAQHYVIIEEGRSIQGGAMADLVQDKATIQRYLGAA